RCGTYALHARTAETVHCMYRDLNGKSGEQQGHARNVAVVLVRLVGAAEDHVLALCRLDMRTIARFLQNDRGEVVRTHVLELSAVAAHRRARRGDDYRLGHYFREARLARKLRTPSANSLLAACASWRYDSNSIASS